MPRLDQTLKNVQQRTGDNTGRLRTDADRVAFSKNVKTDLAVIINQLNSVYKPLVETLASEFNLDALDYGLSGNIIFTHINATPASALAFYDTSLNRPRTIKETVDVLISEVARLETEISRGVDPVEYDDSLLRSAIDRNELNLQQLKKDTVGSNYTFDNDGLADLTYPLSQHIDAIGSFFSNFPTTGNTYSGTYPSLALEVLLSQVTIDTTLPQSTITNLSNDLTNIRNFIGMATVGPELPNYSDHGSISVVSDGDTLEQAIQKLDAASGGGGGGTTDLQTAFENGNSIIIPNGNGVGVEIVSNDTTSNAAIEVFQNVSKVAVRIDSDTASYTEPALQTILNSASGKGAEIKSSDNNAYASFVDTRISGSAATKPSHIAFFNRNKSSANTAAPVVTVQQQHASDDQVALEVIQNGEANALSVTGDGYVDGDFEITGKLTVAGLIDPTGLVTDYLASAPVGALEAKGTFWSRNDNTPMWTDEDGVDYELSGGGLHASTHIQGGADEIDGDKLDIDFTPSFYTPTTAPGEVDHVDQLSAHLAGIDVAIGAGGGGGGGETLAQTLILGNLTGSTNIIVSSDSAIVGEDAADSSNDDGGYLILGGGVGDGTGGPGNIGLYPGIGGDFNSGGVGIGTASPQFLLDLDVNSSIYPDETWRGIGAGDAWIGSYESDGMIAHRDFPASDDQYAIKFDADGNLDFNTFGGASIRLRNGNSTILGTYTANGYQFGSMSSDPTGANGRVYYNSSGNRFRVYENGAWTNMRAFSTTGTVTSNAPGSYANDDFVFGSPVLSGAGVGNYSRFQFDKDKVAFRAGYSDGTQWSDANSGLYSFASGYNPIASGTGSVAFGRENTTSGTNASILGGGGSGIGNTNSGSRSIIGGGQNNEISNSDSFIGAGDTNEVTGANSSVLSGTSNTVSGTSAAAIAGSGNSVTTTGSIIGAGQLNLVDGVRSGIVTGSSNVVSGIDSFIGTGTTNDINLGSYCAIAGGQVNIIGGGASGVSDFIGGGASNLIGSVSATSRSGIVAGQSNVCNSSNSIIGAGQANNIDSGTANVICGGGGSSAGNLIDGAGPVACFIGAGQLNTINVVAGSSTLGHIRSEDDPETGPAPTPPMKNQHVIAGGYSNLILNSGASGGELGFIGGGAYNEINDSEGQWHGNAIVGGFNNLIEGNRYNLIGNGYENQILNAANDSLILGGRQNTVDGADYALILNGDSNSATADYAAVISGTNLTANTYQAVYQGHRSGYAADMVFWGDGPASAVTNTFYLSINDAGGPVTSVSGLEGFNVSGDSGHFLFVGEFTAYYEQSAVGFFVSGRIWGQGYRDGGTWTWVQRSFEGYSGASNTWLTASNLRFIANGNNEILIAFDTGDGMSNHSISVAVKAVHRRDLGII